MLSWVVVTAENNDERKPLRMVACVGCGVKNFIAGDLAPLATVACNRCGHVFAADAHDCIMVRILGPTGYKVVARLIRARKRAPL